MPPRRRKSPAAPRPASPAAGVQKPAPPSRTVRRRQPSRRKRAQASVVTPGIPSVCASNKRAKAEADERQRAIPVARKRRQPSSSRGADGPAASPVRKRPRGRGVALTDSPGVSATPDAAGHSAVISAAGSLLPDGEPVFDARVGAEIGAGRSYFEAHKGAVRTSNLTLANVNVMPAAALENAMLNLTDELAAEQTQLLERQRSHFSDYAFLLAAGHSLLFYGYGSKKSLLDQFAAVQSSSCPVVGVNGYHPTLSLRTVLTQISSDILRLPPHPKRSLLDYVSAIRNGIGSRKILVTIHNIDGAPLRSQESQHALASLSAIDNISLIASIDHVNAPLLWDGVSYSTFRWTWLRADTFLPYTTETVFCTKPMLRGGGERRVEGAIALLNSLSAKARGVFQVLAELQTGGETTRNGDTLKGVQDKTRPVHTTFNQLFDTTKERFLTSDPATLKLTLTELQTHDLLESRRGADVAEQIWVPLDVSQLKTVLREIGAGA